MRRYCLISTKKEVTYFGDGPDALETLFKGTQYEMDTNELIRSGLLEFFSPKEAKKIIIASQLPNTTLIRLSNTSMWIPISRLKYLPFLAVMLIGSLAFSNPISIRSTIIGPFTVPTSSFIFPISFVFTDIINELFGYQTTKLVIRYISTTLFILAFPMLISIYLPDAVSHPGFIGTRTSDSINTSFKVMYADMPERMIIIGISLLIADTCNAYLFTQIKNLLQGKKLWLRSLISNMSGITIYSLVFTTIFCWDQLLILDTYSQLFTKLGFRTIYFIVALPIIYIICYYIRSQETKTTTNYSAVAFSR